MHVVSKTRLTDFWETHPDAEMSLRAWHTLMKAGHWTTFAELRMTFPSADQVALPGGKTVTVFNIGGNNYRLIAGVRYRIARVFVLMIMTHAEYSKERWKNKL